jgi:tryptophan-rich sensory protein
MAAIKTKDVLMLTISMVICQGAGFIGFLVTQPSIPAWYATLEKPSFVFARVDHTLFAHGDIGLPHMANRPR